MLTALRLINDRYRRQAIVAWRIAKLKRTFIMKTLINLGLAVEETKGQYFCATRQDGNAKITGTDGKLHRSTADAAQAVAESASPVDPL
jgi:hypothetical protein